jgi:hypothetical protein
MRTMAWKGLEQLYRYARAAEHRRRRFIDWRWRFLVFALVLVLFSYAYGYLRSVYFVVVEHVPGKVPFLLSERLLEWFAYGFFAGFLVFALLAEGEFLIGLRRVTRDLERGVAGFERAAERAVGLRRPARGGRRA